MKLLDLGNSEKDNEIRILLEFVNNENRNKGKIKEKPENWEEF